jgi:DNA-binding winged helix-turn-helix (wHTH) protein
MLDQLGQLGLSGMAQAFAELEASDEAAALTHADWLGLLLDRELTHRRDKRLAARLRYARLRQPASVEDVDYRAPRGLDRALFQKLTYGEWIDAHDNLILCGPTGVGKSWLACALGHKACRDNRSVLYQRVPYTLGPLRLDTQHNLLLREGAPVPFGRRAIALLRTLIERPGALVSKDALIEAAWSGRLVEESNLPVQIAALRRVLGEASGGDRWIETMPGRGYRFIGPIVTEMEQGAMAPPPQVDTAQEPAPEPRADAERRQITAMSCELIGISGEADGVGLE